MDEGTFNKVIELNDKLSDLERFQFSLTTASLELRCPIGTSVKMSDMSYYNKLIDSCTEKMQEIVKADINAIKKQIEAL